MMSSAQASPPITPLVSVLIPTYNRADFLREALDSVLVQTFPNIEIIVVDDGSTDITATLMERYRDKVTYYRQANRGVAAARNAALALARGELLALMDSDDICLPQRVAIQAACLSQIPDAVLCSSDFSAFSAKGLIENSHIASYYGLVASTPGGVKALYSERVVLKRDDSAGFRAPINVYSGQVYEQLVWGNFIHPPTVMVRRSAVERVGGFDERIPIATEYDWLIRVSRTGIVAYIGAPLLRYRYSGSQLTSPRHSAQIELDTVTTLEKVHGDDVGLYRKHQRRFERRIGNCYLHAASASIEYNKMAAVGQLWQSVLHGMLTVTTLKVIVKLLLPRALLGLYQHLRSVAVTASTGGMP